MLLGDEIVVDTKHLRGELNLRIFYIYLLLAFSACFGEEQKTKMNSKKFVGIMIKTVDNSSKNVVFDVPLKIFFMILFH